MGDNTIHDLIETAWARVDTATKERDTAAVTYYSGIAQRLEDILKEVEECGILLAGSTKRRNAEFEIPHRKRKRRAGSHFLPPDGTKCRFEYKGITFDGIIKDMKLLVDGYGAHNTFSSASVEITQTSRNGWRDWWVRLPDTNEWILAREWRRKRKEG